MGIFDWLFGEKNRDKKIEVDIKSSKKEDLWVCNKCNEENEQIFTNCWKCRTINHNLIDPNFELKQKEEKRKRLENEIHLFSDLLKIENDISEKINESFFYDIGTSNFNDKLNVISQLVEEKESVKVFLEKKIRFFTLYLITNKSKNLINNSFKDLNNPFKNDLINELDKLHTELDELKSNKKKMKVKGQKSGVYFQMTTFITDYIKLNYDRILGNTEIILNLNQLYNQYKDYRCIMSHEEFLDIGKLYYKDGTNEYGKVGVVCREEGIKEKIELILNEGLIQVEENIKQEVIENKTTKDGNIIINCFGWNIREIRKHDVPYIDIEISSNQLENLRGMIDYDLDDILEDWNDREDGLKPLEVNGWILTELLDDKTEFISVERLSYNDPFLDPPICITQIDITYPDGKCEIYYINRDTGQKYDEKEVLEIISIDNVNDVDWSNETYGGFDYYLVQDFKLEEVLENSFE